MRAERRGPTRVGPGVRSACCLVLQPHFARILSLSLRVMAVHSPRLVSASPAGPGEYLRGIGPPIIAMTATSTPRSTSASWRSFSFYPGNWRNHAREDGRLGLLAVNAANRYRHSVKRDRPSPHSWARLLIASNNLKRGAGVECRQCRDYQASGLDARMRATCAVRAKCIEVEIIILAGNTILIRMSPRIGRQSLDIGTMPIREVSGIFVQGGEA